jgi:hypothetical protein
MSPMLETKVAEVVRAVRDACARFTADLTRRVEELEARQAPQGEKGLQGDKGEKGEAGTRGADGQPGEKGDPGEPGPKGDRGEPGPKGDAGDKGLTGDRGVEGKDGRDGREGKDGRDGIDGRDAAEIIPLAGIDLERSYGIGTWASHEGGLWVARTLTKGLEGWSCSVDGIAAITVRGFERGFEVEVRRSSGNIEVTRCAVPAMLYRGIWQEQEGGYEAGDLVTRDGSMWHANAPTKGKPGDTPEWQLCVRRGRDGKDGIKGEKGERGGEGRAGRDLTQLGPDGAKW